MQENLSKIDISKHIEIIFDKDYIFVASALYTYALIKHKKVSLISKEKNLDYTFSFIPWFEKIKYSEVYSSDLKIDLKISAQELYDFFLKDGVKINQKMATALYSSLLYETDGFLNNKTDGTSFALASKLIEYKADFVLAKSYILEYQTLGSLRLKSKMLENMLLVNGVDSALFFIKKSDLKSTRSTLFDAIIIMKEAFRLPYVKRSILLDAQYDNEVIKILEKGI